MTYESKELLIEKAASAFRERNTSGRILPSASWFDLAPEDRDALFARQLESRQIERALSRDGMSTTVKAVLDRLRIRNAQ
jgi:hypothetical protein